MSSQRTSSRSAVVKNEDQTVVARISKQRTSELSVNVQNKSSKAKKERLF